MTGPGGFTGYSNIFTGPTGGATTTEVMVGLNRQFVPSLSGKVAVFISGLVHQTIADVGVTIKGRYSTGTAPAAGVAATGTEFGRAQRTFQSGNTQYDTFLIHGVINGLAIGPVSWFDLSIVSGATGAALVQDVQFTILEGA
jgi:hypothetical protein